MIYLRLLNACTVYICTVQYFTGRKYCKTAWKESIVPSHAGEKNRTACSDWGPTTFSTSIMGSHYRTPQKAKVQGTIEYPEAKGIKYYDTE